MTDPAITAIDKVKVDMSVPSSDGGSAILSYSLEMDDGEGGPFAVLYGDSVASLSLTFTNATGITRGAVYRVRSRSRNIIGWSAYSPVGYVRAAVKPAAPPAPTFVAATATTITVSLKPVEDNGGATISAYELFIDDGALGLFTQVTRYSGLATSFTIDNSNTAVEEAALPSGRTFRLQYRATNEINFSDFSAIVSVAMIAAPA